MLIDFENYTIDLDKVEIVDSVDAAFKFRAYMVSSVMEFAFADQTTADSKRAEFIAKWESSKNMKGK